MSENVYMVTRASSIIEDPQPCDGSWFKDGYWYVEITDMRKFVDKYDSVIIKKMRDGYMVTIYDDYIE